jgi:hypothetical protein
LSPRHVGVAQCFIPTSESTKFLKKKVFQGIIRGFGKITIIENKPEVKNLAILSLEKIIARVSAPVPAT